MVGSAGAGAADPDPDDLCAHPGVDRALELLDEARDVDLLQKVQSLKRQAAKWKVRERNSCRALDAASPHHPPKHARR